MRASIATAIVIAGCMLAPVMAWAGPVPAPTTTITTTSTTSTTSTTTDPTMGPTPTTVAPSPVPDAAPGTTGGDTRPTADITPPTIGVKVTHPHFSPNGDGVRDKVFIELTAEEPVSATLMFRNASGSARKTEQYEFGPGRVVVSWGGRIRRNGVWQRAADGAYEVRITATDGAGNSVQKTRPLAVDTARPTFGWSSITPDPWGATGAVSYNFISHDASGPLNVRASAWDREGVLDLSSTATRPSGSVAFGWRPNHSDGGLFLPGNYFAAVQVTDQAGNTVTGPFRGFRVERSVTSIVVRRVEGAGNRVALTFDDCNDGNAWDSILATLQHYGVTATFFCPGDQVVAHPAQARATAVAGHSIGSHSNGHAQLNLLPYADIVARLRIDQVSWWNTARVTPSPYFRPPYGSYDATVLDAAGDTGFRYTIIWDVDPQDWTSPGSSVIVSRVLASVRPGSIVLMHVKSQTAMALPAILNGLRSRGLQQSSMAQLLHAAGVR